MAKYSLDLKTSEPDEIILNRHGDKISISADDAGIWNRFLSGCKEIENASNMLKEKIRDTEKEHGDRDGIDTDPPESDVIFEARVEYCERAAKIIDGMFGEGTIKKAFRDDYEAIPGFIPDEGKIWAFIETLTPIMEDIFGKKIDQMEKASRKRMEKYIPKGHKKKKK